MFRVKIIFNTIEYSRQYNFQVYLIQFVACFKTFKCIFRMRQLFAYTFPNPRLVRSYLIVIARQYFICGSEETVHLPGGRFIIVNYIIVNLSDDFYI